MMNKNFPVTVTKRIIHVYGKCGAYSGYVFDESEITVKPVRIVAANPGDIIYPIKGGDNFLFSTNPEHSEYNPDYYFSFYGTLDEISEFVDKKELFAAILYLSGK